MDHRRTRIVLVILLLLGVALVVSGAGCTGAPGELYACTNPLVGRLDHLGKLDQCCAIDPCPCSCIDSHQYPCDATTGYVPSNILDCKLNDAGTDASASCGGTCAPFPPLGEWEGPVLFWSGPSGTAPTCPEQAPAIGYQGHGDDLVSSPLCDACSCSPSTGRCAPPASMTASSAQCGQPGTTTPFDGPVAWDGSCSAHDCIGPAPQCTHGLSVTSLAVGPLVVADEVCAASPTTSNPNTPTWMTDVLACRGLVMCGNAGAACVPAAMPSGFKTCIYHDGNTPCPDSYPEQHLAYTGFDDTRACTTCECGKPAGGSCSGTLTLFTDAACAMQVAGSPPLSSSGPACVPAGLPLGSKTLTLSPYQAGACAPTGGPSGAAQATGPSTFCCLVS